MPEGKMSLEMRIGFSSEKKAESALRALAPELSGKHERRAQTKASVKKNFLAFSVIAEDSSALKASMSSLSKSIALIKDLIGG